MGAHLEPAVPAGTDPHRHARQLARIREAVLGGGRAESRPRPLIDDSWQRLIRDGVNPHLPADRDVLTRDEVEQRRHDSGLAELIPLFGNGLLEIADEASHIAVLTDASGRVLWREGASRIKLRADRVALTEGVRWSESCAGTNALGTTLTLRRAVQVFSAEHFASWLHGWTCAAAPIHDPRSGELLGAIDVSGPAATVHASTLLLVDAVARLARKQLHTAHQADLERLRSAGAPILARIDGTAVVTDEHGWVAARHGSVPDRLLLPEPMRAGECWLPALGRCQAAPLPGGWLVRSCDDEAPLPAEVTVDCSQPRQAVLRVRGAGGDWSHRLTPRHAELLLVLAHQPDGRSAAELACDLFGDGWRAGTVRAELCRVRRQLGGVLEHRPYRFADGVRVRTVLPDPATRLLPSSAAPVVRQLRHTAASR